MHCNPYRQWFFKKLVVVWHIVVFWQCGLESLPVLENRSRSKVGSFYPWNQTEKWISQSILPDCKVFWMTLEQLFDLFIKLPIFDSSRAICVLVRGQYQLLVPSGWRRTFINKKKGKRERLLLCLLLHSPEKNLQFESKYFTFEKFPPPPPLLHPRIHRVCARSLPGAVPLTVSCHVRCLCMLSCVFCRHMRRQGLSSFCILLSGV